jgi:hypothetical protein
MCYLKIKCYVVQISVLCCISNKIKWSYSFDFMQKYKNIYNNFNVPTVLNLNIFNHAQSLYKCQKGSP